jgi:uncharacterized BrkB/YihY/UPF0761 family membrane protein
LTVDSPDDRGQPDGVQPGAAQADPDESTHAVSATVNSAESVSLESSGLAMRFRAGAHDRIERITAQGDHLRKRSTAVDVGVRVYERDKHAAGTLLGSALSLRLFSFFVPLVLFAVGVAGLLGQHAGVDSVSEQAGLTGSLANEIDAAFAQGSITPWLAIGFGLLGTATTGRSLTRALVLSSALSWNLGGKQKIPVRVVGIVVGIIVGVTLAAAITNRIRAATGLALGSVSFVGVAAVYVVLWSVLYTTLPRGTTDPGAALPGASIVAIVLAGMQAVTQLYLPNQIENASMIYGSVGVAIATLGWFFFMGRAIAFSFAVNAVVFEQIGSVSQFVFGLPGLRTIPHRVPSIARFFDLDERSDRHTD